MSISRIAKLENLCLTAIRCFTTSSAAYISPSPSSSSTTSSYPLSAESQYKRPIPVGQIPAYDEALIYLQEHQRKQLQIFEEMKTRDPKPSVKELEEQEVNCYINDPEVLWNFKNKKEVDLSKPIYRLLKDREWRFNGDLSYLMYSVTDKFVIPDIISFFTPTVDVKVTIDDKIMKPSTNVDPKSTLTEPSVEAIPLHTEEKLYSLVMINPDYPSEANESYINYCHFLRTNIPLSVTRTKISEDNSTTIQSYIPPHPQSGTGRHRYAIILMEQSAPASSSTESAPTTTQKITVDTDKWCTRKEFDVRQFMKEYNLQPAGLHFVTASWSPTVSEIYRDVLGEKEPNYGQPGPLNADTAFGRIAPNKYELI